MIAETTIQKIAKKNSLNEQETAILRLALFIHEKESKNEQENH